MEKDGYLPGAGESGKTTKAARRGWAGGTKSLECLEGRPVLRASEGWGGAFYSRGAHGGRLAARGKSAGDVPQVRELQAGCLCGRTRGDLIRIDELERGTGISVLPSEPALPLRNRAIPGRHQPPGPIPSRSDRLAPEAVTGTVIGIGCLHQCILIPIVSTGGVLP